MMRTYEIDLDDKLVDDCEKIYGELGIDAETAIKMFLKQSVLRNGFPFEVVIPAKQEAEITETENKTETNEQTKAVQV